MTAASSFLRALVEATSVPRTLRLRWVTMRNDARWIVSDLRGGGRPVLVPRGPSRYKLAASSAITARPLRIERVIRETDDAISIVLAELDGAPLAFEAGQFLTFDLEIGERLVRRAYSLSSSPLDGPSAAITVKRMGLASGWLHANARAGLTLSARGPSGSFVAPAVAARLVMIAGGSGITPVISIAETALRARPELAVSLIYGNRSERDVIFAERLERLRSAHPERLTIEHAYGAVLDREGIAARIDRVPSDRPHVYYLCGPRGMMDAAREVLEARGVRDQDIREERFQSPAEVSSIDLPREPVIAEMRVHGRRHLVSVQPGQTLLEAGLAAGAPMPFSCAMGGCGACKVLLIAGEVHAETTCLSERERAEGYVLACSSRPKGRVAIEVRAKGEVP